MWDEGQSNAVQGLIVASTAAIVIAGDIYGVVYKHERGQASAVFFGLLVALLLPTVIFALGVRQARVVYVYGSLLFGLTAAAWLPVFVSGGAFRGSTSPSRGW